MPSNNHNNNNNNHKVVPYFVLTKNDDHDHKSKVLFTVPSHFAVALIQHPILCRGAAFTLQLDQEQPPHVDNTTTTTTTTSTCFLSTEFISPHPESTAQEIAKRLASRMQDSCPNPLPTIFGF